MPRLEIPPRYRGPTLGRERIDVDGASVRACLEAVEAEYPGFRELVLEPDGELRRFVRLFVNGDQLAADALDTPVDADDSIEILAAVAGG